MAGVCHATIAPASETLPYHENFELHRERLAEIGTLLNSHGIKFGVSLLAAPAHRADRQYQFIHDAEALVTLVRSIPDGHVGIEFDTWNWHFGGGTLDQLRAVADLVVAVSLADAPADATAETVTEEQRLLPAEKGVIDNIGYLRALQEASFDGQVMVKPHPAQLSGKPRDEVVRNCSQLLDDLLKLASQSPAESEDSTDSAEPAMSG